MNLKKYIFGLRKHVGFLPVITGMLSCFLFSCSENLDVTPGIRELPEGTILLNIAVPDPVTVSTRVGGESAVNTVDIFIFDKDNHSFLQHQTVQGSKIVEGAVPVSLASTVKNKEANFYAVVNAPEGVAALQTIEGLEGLKDFILTAPVDIENGFTMIGSKVIDTASEFVQTIPVYRNVAKISASVTAENATLKEFYLYNYANEGILGAPLTAETVTDEEYPFSNDLSSDALTLRDKAGYVYPSKSISAKGMDDGAFVVVKVDRTGKGEQYYRLNLRKGDDVKDGNLTYIGMRANHWYQIRITAFLNDGYDTAEEAVKHPDSDQLVAYTIHDHASEVLSMVTDGMYELGVTPEVTLTSANDKVRVVIKCYDPNRSDTNIPEEELSFPSSGKDSWIVIEPNGYHNYKEDNIKNSPKDPDPSWDRDNGGTQFEYLVSLDPKEKDYEDRVGKFTVEWKGLKREVIVYYQSAFLMPSVSDAELTITNTDKSTPNLIKDYWKFIASEGTQNSEKWETTGDAPKLFGIKPENMVDGKKRINGFHFPMPYGMKHSSEPWTYEYTVDFSKILDRNDTGNSITGITATFNGDDFIKNNVEWVYNSGTTGILRMKGGQTLYDYAGGTVTFRISYGGDYIDSDVTASIYHTGFFHYEGNPTYVPDDKCGYYYYEVVPMGNEGDYWLDRNIGATANTSYIDVEDANVNENNNKDAAGYLYTIITKPNDFQLPDWDFNMVPPGYHIPNSTEWDNLRLNDRFTTTSVVIGQSLYLATYYASENSKVGKVYFQKSRFFNEPEAYKLSNKFTDCENANVGDAGAAYYWSITEAPAMEKQQMGNWMRGLYLNGSSSSYVNSSVTDHRMSVRCKAGTKDEATEPQEYYISFNVHDATHVYFFDKTTQTPLFNFPGRTIGTTLSADMWQNFYCSVTEEIDDLLMLFVKLQLDGTVTIYYRDGDSFKKTVQYSKNLLTSDKAWTIQNGYNYDLCELAMNRAGGNVTKDKPTSEEDCSATQESEPESPPGHDEGIGSTDEFGNYTWTGSLDIYWSNALQTLGYGAYNWNSVPVNSTLTLTFDKLDGFWGIRLSKANDWKEITGGNLENINSPYTVTLNAKQLEELRNNNGLVITGNCYRLTKVELKIAK